MSISLSSNLAIHESQSDNDQDQTGDGSAQVDTSLIELNPMHRELYEFAKKHGRDPSNGTLYSVVHKTRNEKTYLGELSQLDSLVERYCASFGGLDLTPQEIDPVIFVGFVLKLMSQVGANQKRKLKRLCRMFLKRNYYLPNEFALRLLETEGKGTETMKCLMNSEVIQQLNAGRLKEPLPKSEKQFPLADFDAVITHLREESQFKLSCTLVHWLKAGLATGLRPIEWQATVLESIEKQDYPNDSMQLLHVLNAKATNGRANGLVRVIDVSFLSPDVLKSVQFMSVEGRDWLSTGDFDQIRSGCNELLKNVCKDLFKHENGEDWTRYVLYSARHQFILNASVNNSEAEVSALAGHGSRDTAGRHYGLKGSAWSPKRICKVFVAEEQACNVQPEPSAIEEPESPEWGEPPLIGGI